MVDEPEKRSSRELVVAALGQVFAMFMGMALGGPLGPYLGVALGPYGEKWMRRVADELSRKGELVASAALSSSGLGSEWEFYDAVTEDPGLIALMQKIAWAAAVSTYEPKLKTLGTLLGGATARRGDKLDETQLLVSALSDIEEPHIAILDVLTRPAPDDEHYGQKTADVETARANAGPGTFSLPPHRDAQELSSYEPSAWLPEQIQDEAPLDPDFVLACVSVLVRHNLVQALGTYGGGSRFKITRLGLALVKVMQQARDHDRPQPEPSPPL